MIRLIVMIVIVLSSFVAAPAQVKEDIQAVIITFTTYSSNSSYATEEWCFVYKKRGPYYEIDSINPRKDVPKVIKSRIIERFYHQLLNCRGQLCHLLYLDINDKDYKNYLNGIGDFVDEDYRLLLLDTTNRHILDAMRSFQKKDFVLSCHKLQALLSLPEINYKTPFLRIEFIGDNSSNVMITPYSFYKGTPWIIRSTNNELFIDYRHVNRFLKRIDYDRFIHFFDKNILMYDIALTVLLLEKTDN